MKKFIVGIALLSAPLLLAGCGNKKTLNCVIESDGSKAEANLVFSGDKFQKGDVTMVMDYGNAGISEDMMKVIKETKMCDEFLEQQDDDDEMSKAFDKCTEKWDGNKLTLKITIKKSLSDSKDYGTIEEAKKEIEKGGYTCTIK